MLNKEVEHKIFGKCWKMLNTVRKNQTDTGWEKCVNEAHEISESIAEYKKFHEKLVLATIEEAETEEKNKNAKEKSASYKNAGAAFNAAWEMFARFIDNPDEFKKSGMDILAEYNKTYSGRFAKKLGAAIYEVVCAENNCKGTFMKDAYTFYQEFKNGITSDIESDAYAKAERIIDKHPEHMLQMMEMCAELKIRGQKQAAA